MKLTPEQAKAVAKQQAARKKTLMRKRTVTRADVRKALRHERAVDQREKPGWFW